MTRQPK